MALCRFIYGVIKKCQCNEREVHVHYVAIDDLVITTPLKNDITNLWSCSGKAGASLLGQDVVASLLSLCMAKWLRKWRRGWLYVRSNTKNAKSLLPAGGRIITAVASLSLPGGQDNNNSSISLHFLVGSLIFPHFFSFSLGLVFRVGG